MKRYPAVKKWDCEVSDGADRLTNLRILVRAERTWGKRVWRLNLRFKDRHFVAGEALSRLCDSFPQVAEEVVEWWENEQKLGVVTS